MIVPSAQGQCQVRPAESDVGALPQAAVRRTGKSHLQLPCKVVWRSAPCMGATAGVVSVMRAAITSPNVSCHCCLTGTSPIGPDAGCRRSARPARRSVGRRAGRVASVGVVHRDVVAELLQQLGLENLLELTARRGPFCAPARLAATAKGRRFPKGVSCGHRVRRSVPPSDEVAVDGVACATVAVHQVTGVAVTVASQQHAGADSLASCCAHT